ncbi:MAG: hypothetical protein RLZZ265_1940, partial [Verrucomicrobiota bacterium]
MVLWPWTGGGIWASTSNFIPGLESRVGAGLWARRMTKPAANEKLAPLLPAVLCAAVFVLLAIFLGSAPQGYIRTASLFEWWFSQLLNPASESEHGWLILGLSAWLLWRNVRAARGDTADGDAVWPAVVALAVGLALHALGFVAQQTRISI